MQISSKAVTPNDTVAVTVDVQNTGIKAGAEIVQLYASAPNHDGLDRPFRQLRGFAKVNLTPGEKKTVSIPLDLSELYFYNNDGKVIYDPGEYIIELAAASDDIRLTDKITLSGARNLTLQSVSAHPGATVLYVDPDDPTDPNRPVTLTADVSAVLVDDTFLNLSGSGVQVTYNSSDPAIASVDGHGLVTGLSFGVCTITATVTYNNSTKSTSFPIVVKPTMKVINSGLAEDALSVSGLIPTDGVLHPNRIENRNHSVFFSALFGLDMRMDYLADIAVFNPVITWGYDNFDPVGNYTVTVDLPNFAGSEAYLFDMQKSSYTKIEAETVGGKVRCAYDLDKNIYLVIALPGVIGNVSLSKKVDINDARMILQYLVDKIQLSPYQLALGDTTGNGKVDINDARNVLQQLIDKIGDFPRIKFEMDY
ncbi:MAG: fibronectin type III-like domain-contianing protein [Oscillospiraceae bacterium]|nr:fibronectin type III-like domain-contianing protein [Oscillospiraceae bacterium]